MRCVAVKAKKLRYAVELTAAGELREENGVELQTPEEWSPEHLVLAALVRCVLQSLRYHARATADVRSTSGGAHTLVTRRKTDPVYAMVETTLELTVELEPGPEFNLSDLLEFAERDCFVGASLTAEPTYRWTVNGRKIGW